MEPKNGYRKLRNREKTDYDMTEKMKNEQQSTTKSPQKTEKTKKKTFQRLFFSLTEVFILNSLEARSVLIDTLVLNTRFLY